MDYVTQKEKYKSALMKWKSDHFVSWYARLPEEPIYREDLDPMDYSRRLTIWNKQKALWQTAPKPEDYGLVSPLNEHFEIRIGLVLNFGAQHIRLFNYRLLSELDEFEMFLIKNGFRYEYIDKQDGGVEIDIDQSYDFVFSEKSASFNLVVYSSDGVHITKFYFYNDKGYKDESQRVNTIADMHDFFMKDKRVTTKKIKAEKGCQNFIQDYIAPFEVGRIEDFRFFIVTSEEYKKLPKYSWLTIKAEWIMWASLMIFLALLIYSVFVGFSSKTSDNSINQLVGSQPAATYKVYICTGPQSKSYHHDKGCYGLQSCSDQIEFVDLVEAQDQGRKPCKYCFK